jgi:hypothetical protein
MSIGRSRLKNLIGRGILCTYVCVCMCACACVCERERGIIYFQQETLSLNTSKMLFSLSAVETMSEKQLFRAQNFKHLCCVK